MQPFTQNLAQYLPDAAVLAAVFLLLAAAGLGGFLWQIRHTLLLAPDGIHMEGGSDYAVG